MSPSSAVGNGTTLGTVDEQAERRGEGEAVVAGREEAVPVDEAGAQVATRYRVVTRAVLRSGRAMDSAKVGELEVGEVLAALERSVLPSGGSSVVRVRCEAGWASEISSSGVRILSPMTAAEEKQQLQTEKQRQEAAVAEAEAAAMASQGPGYALGSSASTVRLPGDLADLAQALAVAPDSRTKPQRRCITSWLEKDCVWMEHRHPTALERDALLSCIGVREAPTGTVLTREGETPGSRNAFLYVVLVGELGLFMGNVPQKRIGPGMEVGEEALVMSDA